MTKSEVFIIESLDWDDELEERYEGRILTDILRLSGKSPLYYYVRTKQELKEVMKRFQSSNYRYLHLSCHGDAESVATTLDDVYFEELGQIINPYLNKRRLFVSSCEVVNKDLAKTIIQPSGCSSIAGPTEEVYFSDAAILWASFYKLAFDRDSKRMNPDAIRCILSKLANLFRVQVAYFGKTTKSYSTHEFGPPTS